MKTMRGSFRIRARDEAQENTGMRRTMILTTMIGAASLSAIAETPDRQIDPSPEATVTVQPIPLNAPARFVDGSAQEEKFELGHPPLHLIPAMPLPEPTAQQRLNDAPMGVPVSHDGATNELIEYPMYIPFGPDKGDHGGYTAPYGHLDHEAFNTLGFGTMTEVANDGVDPWRRNVKIVMRFLDSGGTSRFFVCSGTMADPETVLTAGHCVYAHTPNGLDINDWAEEFWIYPGWDGNGITGDEAQIIQTHGIGHGTIAGAFTGWTDDANFKWDMGLIRITRAVGHLTGWYGYAWGQSCDTIMGRSYNLGSYPAEGCGSPGLHNGADQYYWFGGYDDCNDDDQQLFFNTTPGCFTAQWGGMSGGGSYYFNDNDVRVVHAVVSNSNNATFANHTRMWTNFKDFMLDFENTSRGTNLDLQMLRVRYVESSVTAGDTIEGDDYAVPNPTNNDPASASYSVSHYLSTNANISTADTLIGTESYTLDYAPVQNANVNNTGVNYTIPLDTPSGTYYVGAILNTTDANTGNNDGDQWDCQEIQVFGVADIDPSSIATNGSSGFLGETVNVTFDIDNLGGDLSNALSVEVYASTNTTITTFDTLLGSFSYTGLSGGGSTTRNVTVTLPASVGVGTRYIGIIATSSDDVNSTNNTIASSAYTVNARADMAGRTVDAEDGSHSRGMVMPVDYSFTNIGLGASGPVSMEVRASTNTFISTSDELLGTINFGSVAPGAIVSGTANVTVPFGITLGDYYIGIIVDPGDFENVTTNNTAHDPAQVTIVDCPADLNNDGSLDFFDMNVLLQNDVDYNGDTSFDFFDISAFLQDLQMGCP